MAAPHCPQPCWPILTLNACAQSRHKTDIEKLKKERLELADKVNSLQNQIYKVPPEALRPLPPAA